jgi:hypothetical protein
MIHYSLSLLIPELHHKGMVKRLLHRHPLLGVEFQTLLQKVDGDRILILEVALKRAGVSEFERIDQRERVISLDVSDVLEGRGADHFQD